MKRTEPKIEQRTSHSLAVDVGNVTISASSENRFGQIVIRTGLSELTIDRHRAAALAEALTALDGAIAQTLEELTCFD